MTPMGFRMFNDAQLNEIHHGSLEILRRTGVRVQEAESLALLKDAGVGVIPTVGQPFDPHLHVAVGTAEREDVPHGLIVAEQRRGYRLNDNVLRFAEVIIARRSVILDTTNHTAVPNQS